MPIRFEEIQRIKARDEKRFEPAAQKFEGVLVGHDYTTSANAKIKPGYVWYRSSDQANLGLARLLNPKLTPPTPGLAVILQRETTEPYEVVVVDWNTSLTTQLNDYSGETPGTAKTYTYLRDIGEFLAYPGSGVTLNVAPLFYIYNGGFVQFVGHNAYSLSASIPGSGLARYSLVYINRATNALATQDGATTQDSQAITPNLPSLPANAIPVVLVRLYNGQTAIAETDILDARQLFTSEITASETSQGVIELATQAEVTAGIDAERAVTPATLAGLVESGGSTLTVNNGSGATATTNDVGYIDESGEYQTTTTANLEAAWCVVVTGGANGVDIEVAVRGDAMVAYAGTAPSAGDYLVTSSTAGSASQQTTMRPEIFAVCTAAGSGGTAEALLLTQTAVVAYTSGNPLQQSPVLVGDSDWTGTINGTPSGSTLVYTTSTGDENWLEPFDVNALAKLRLYNSTRSEHALISDTNTSTNTITLTAAVPGTWDDTDSIHIRSTTNTDTSGSAYFLEYEITDEVPELARYIVADLSWQDTGANGQRCALHPFEAFAAAQAFFLNSSTVTINARSITMPLIERRYTIRADASGSGTCFVNLYMMAYGVAAP